MTKRILIVDDNRLIVNLLRVNLLSSGYGVITASDGFSALRAAISERPDLILLDVMMPEMDGFEVARQIRNNTLIAHVPIIMLTARGSVDSVVEGLDAGADDYICKPFEMTEVLARIKAHLRRSRSERSLNPITGLPGNMTIVEGLKQLVAKNEPYAVIYTDIDNFKSFNDSYGFLQGDEAIKLLASSILASVQKFGNTDDFIGHIGGDDFVICSTPQKVDGICQDIIRRFEDQIRTLYRPEHREQGYVIGVSRDGQEVRHALITVSLAVVTNEHRTITCHWEIGEIAAELKRAAKQLDHSIYIKDLRTSRGLPPEPTTQRHGFSGVPSVVMLTQDKVLKLVSPVLFKRMGLDLVVVNAIELVPATELIAVVVDANMLNADVEMRIASWKSAGTSVYLLVSVDQRARCSELDTHHCFDKPLNISQCASVIRTAYNELKERM
ncbi:MAG: response regulator receiver [Bacillota bacterium]|nr:MAG: response regulator receiver [Bacillota bacterium]MBS3950012.1 response regulator [Peptococcaceae bacterium]